ncbi:hypothetical protein BH10ACT10_BH10ACT10_12220 [soil metagenome]
MSLPRTLRRAAVLTAVTALVAPLVGSAPASASESRPTNAGKVFRWGNAQWADDYIGPVKGTWSLNRPRQINNQHGMLTITGTAGGGDVVATLTGHARRYGRWETRVRAEQYTRGGAPYHVLAELVPTGDNHCGARNIVLEDYALGTSRARMAVRNLPNRAFTAGKLLDLRPGPFHTYAVEVTKTHVSWFVDTRVIMTERRDSALSGATYAFRFRLVDKPGARMNPGRMQMDWLRYYSLARQNAHSIAAPQATQGTYAGAC